MVFGFGEGKIELFLDKTSFGFGENIHGQLKLSLKKEKQARKLKLILQGTEERTQFSAGTAIPASGGIRSSSIGIGGVSRTKQSVIIYSNETILDGEKLYAVGEKEYEFTIQAPKETAAPKMPQGTIGKVIGAMQTLSGASRTIKWELKASLDVPGKDISKNVQISIG